MLFNNNYFNEKVLLPINDLISGKTINKHLKMLNKSQWWTEEELINYQNEKLKILIKHAFENVPYYNNLFKSLNLTPGDFNTQEDLQKLPILTKEIMRQNFPDYIVAKNFDPKKLILSGSSGSTGQPLQYYMTKDALSFSRACNLRGWYWMGFRLGDSYLKISTMGRSSAYKKMQDYFNNCTFVHSRSLSEEDILKIIDSIRKSNSKVVRGYPASLYIIASYLKTHDINDIYLDSINTTSEPLYFYMRKLIEEMFHCNIFDSYSCEGGAIISQCENHDLYHISSEKSILEFIRNGENVTDGKAKMIFTDLTNFATPFIRYDSNDIATLTDIKCNCGRGLPVLSIIEGRDTDILVTPTGKFITFYFFAGYFEHDNAISIFQFVQDEIDEFTLRIVPNPSYSKDYEIKMLKDICDVLGSGVKLNLEIMSDIPLTKSGKRRFFIRNPKININI